MNWKGYLRRGFSEVLIFFLVFTVTVYLVTGRDSLANSIYMGIAASVFYGGFAFVLRQRTLRRQQNE